MILVRLMGGLGNQMFQYSAGRALADRLGVDLILDTREFERHSLRSYQLDRFNIRARVGRKSELALWPNLVRRPLRFAQKFGLASAWYFESKPFDKQAWMLLTDNIMLDGYFQSDKYFEEIEFQLKKDFQLTKPLSGFNAEIEDMASKLPSVMVHIRRGDYVANKKNYETHGICSIEYYINAIYLIRKKMSNPHFFIFSDDMDWVKKNLNIGSGTTYVEGNNSCPEIDLYLMSRCHSHIIANSTFSWWGAWLSDCDDKNIIAPTPWFGHKNEESPDLFGKQWYLIDR